MSLAEGTNADDLRHRAANHVKAKHHTCGIILKSGRKPEDDYLMAFCMDRDCDGYYPYELLKDGDAEWVQSDDQKPARPYGIGSDVWPGLAKLTEEMGELQQLLGKVMACDKADGIYWDGTNLRPRLIEELGDVQAALTFFGQTNGFRTMDVRDRAQEKLDKFRFWHRKHGGQ